jgi:hydroxymethylpyrimidine pyrophosphatase-like HAD family hydrolase
LPAGSEVELVALDLDGTVLDHDERLSDRVRSAVGAVAAAGVHVVVATGRSVLATLPVLDRLGLVEGWAVCSNGALTLRLDPALPSGYEIVAVSDFDPGPALRLLREHLPGAMYAVENVGVGYWLTAPFPDGELSGEQTILTFEELMEVPATRVIVRSTEHTPEEFLELSQLLGMHGVNYAVGWTAWLDLAPDGVSKASALEPVRATLGVDRDATLAIGDGRNDLEMFAWAGRAVAMGQAVPEVAAAADEVAPTVDHDGVADVLESLLPG